MWQEMRCIPAQIRRKKEAYMILGSRTRAHRGGLVTTAAVVVTALAMASSMLARAAPTTAYTVGTSAQGQSMRACSDALNTGQGFYSRTVPSPPSMPQALAIPEHSIPMIEARSWAVKSARL